MTVLFILPKSLLLPRKDLLLYYLYCLCKSVQRSLLFEECSFSKADAKVKTFKHILQIFSEVFFKFFSHSKQLSCERKNWEKVVFTARLKKKYFNQRCFLFESGCKGKNFISYLPNVFGSFFSFFFLKGKVSKETNRLRKKKVRVLTPFLSECQSNAAPVLESGCKSRAF